LSTPKPPTKKQKVVYLEVTKKATEIGSTLLLEEAILFTKAAKKTIKLAPFNTINNYTFGLSNLTKAICYSTQSIKATISKTPVAKT
jgi:hypothetical protein